MKRFIINFIKVAIGVFIFFIALYFISFLFTWTGKFISRHYFIFVDYLLINYSVEPEMTLGVTSILLFFVLPLSIYITEYQNYWSKDNKHPLEK